MGVFGEVHAEALVAEEPRKVRDVRDGEVRAGEEPFFGQAAIEDAEEALALVGVPVDGVGDLLRGVHAEVVRLTEHRPRAAHLEEDPLQRRGTAAAPAVARSFFVFFSAR